MIPFVRERALAVIAAVCAPVVVATAQVPPPQVQAPSVVITGSVVDFDGRPIEGATVTVGFPKGGTPAASLLTPSSGRFVATVEPGTYRVYASKPGYLNEAKARRYYFGAVHEISVSKAAPPPPNVVIKLAKASVVAGTVRDVDGQPVPSAQVRLLRSWPVGGTESFEGLSLSVSLSARTNDRGEYRITGVEPGNYIAGVFEGLLRDLASREQYGLPNLYPGTTELADALPFMVGIDEEKSGVDFKLLRAAKHTISGQITGLDVTRMYRPMIRLVRSSTSPINGEFQVARAPVGMTGEFSLSNIAPGSYTLSMVDFPRDEVGRPLLVQNFLTNSGGIGVGSMPPTSDFYNGKPTYFVELSIVVEKDITGLVLPAFTGRQLCGQIEFAGAAQVPPQSRAQVRFVRPARINVQLPTVPIGADGRFCSAQMPPGKYLPFVLAGGVGWHLNAVLQGGRTVTGDAIEPGGADVRVVFSDRDADVHGIVTNQKGEAVAGAGVVAFPTDSSHWANFGPLPLQFTTVSTDSKGGYKFLNLPEGRYRAVALSEPARDDWTLTDNLRRLAVNASEVEFKPGVSLLLNLTTRPR